MKAEIGDLICWAPNFGPIDFGIVYGFNINDIPLVKKKDGRKHGANSVYLIVAGNRDGQGVEDPKIVAAIDWYMDQSRS